MPMKNLVVIDADGHVEEHELTFSDKYLDPAFRAQRPQVVATDGLAYWMIEEQLFPRRLGRGCHNLGTPTSYGGKRTLFTQSKPESLESLELRGGRRLRRLQALLGVVVGRDADCVSDVVEVRQRDDVHPDRDRDEQ